MLENYPLRNSRRWKLSGWAFLLVALLLLGACSQHPSSAPPSSRIHAFVSILPEKGFAERIGGAGLTVEVLVGPGRSPATYEPTPQQMTRLAAAAIYFPVGVPFERVWLEKIRGASPSLVMVDCSEGVAKLSMGRGAWDPHIWLDPRRAKIIARHMRDGLAGIDPAHAEDYRRRYEALAADLDALDAELAELLAPARGQSFLVFHPSWSYLAERYGLHQISIEEEGKEPGPRRLVHLIDEARRRGVTSILVQRQFSARTAEAVAREIGARVIRADPLAPDYFENLRAVAREIAAAARPL